MRRALLGAVALAAALSYPVSAAKPLEPFAWGSGTGSSNLIVEQLSDYPYSASNPRFVTNPLLAQGCNWDVNDRLSKVGSGKLTGSTELAYCVVANYDPVYLTLRGMTAWWSANSPSIGAEVKSSDPVSVAVCYQPQDRCFELLPVYVPRTVGQDREAAHYHYTFCGQVIYTPSDPALVEIPGSQAGTETGGLGVVTTARLTITSPQPVDLWAGFSVVSASGLGTDTGFGCPSPRSLDQTDYPFRWTS